MTFAELLKKLPSLNHLLSQYGEMSIFEYATKAYLFTEDSSPLFQFRKQEFLDFIGPYVMQKFDASLSERVVRGLSQNFAVSTAEHHGPMGHPFFFQSSLLRAIAQPDLPVINFATSHVSLGNSSYPRGLVFHGDGEKAPKEYLHLPFFGSKLRMCPVFRLPAYTREDIQKNCHHRLARYLKEGYITKQTYQKIASFTEEKILCQTVLECSTYSEQITALNQSWWGELFPSLPLYIPLDAEQIVIALLQKHLPDNTIIARMVTDISLQPIIEEQFDGISCCFDRAEKQGTYLFWYLDKLHKRHALWRKGNSLCTEDGNISIGMNIAEIRSGLIEGKLIPSGLLIYTIFACYYGITCFGGFSQGDYLPKIQEAYKKLLEFSDNVSREQFSTQGAILNEDMVFLFEKTGEITTALDIHLSRTDFLEAPKNITVSSSVQKMYSEIARCF